MTKPTLKVKSKDGTELTSHFHSLQQAQSCKPPTLQWHRRKRKPSFREILHLPPCLPPQKLAPHLPLLQIEQKLTSNNSPVHMIRFSDGISEADKRSIVAAIEALGTTSEVYQFGFAPMGRMAFVVKSWHQRGPKEHFTVQLWPLGFNPVTENEIPGRKHATVHVYRDLSESVVRHGEEGNELYHKAHGSEEKIPGLKRF
ncbi:hypothetical protein IQ07DRAFT_637901 [Pyrenochaeta sp. DS3sAY3a]|nr:hypothetical protein IQ07DRAFT_637901 [Pyrenochaeta sp. DS3sAY3a]